jgi:lipopolysaccharide export system permease protein
MKNTVNTLGRYFALRLFIMVLMVYGVCVLIVFFIDFVEMMRRAAKVDASAADAAFLTLLRLPSFAELILPFAVLIGAISTFLTFSRSSELTIVRAAGVSVWQFLQPALVVALLIGVFATTVYNPLAARARLAADQVFADSFASKGKSRTRNDTESWIRQDGPDGPSIIYARATADRGTTLAGLTLLQFDPNKKFIERIEADKATLRQGYWELENANVSSPGSLPRNYKKYLVSTHLNETQVGDKVDTADSVSFWDLPHVIEFTEKAGFNSTPYSLQYDLLLARPFLMVAMVLLAATCALRPFRFGKIQTMVIAGLSGGFGVFVLIELSRKLGMSGYITTGVAAWAPIAIACLMAFTVLLHQEDG